jgi:molybdopterin synthase sulfur carrier subunit
MLTVQLRYFASIREDLNCDSESWQTHVSTVGALRDELVARGPAFQCLASDQPVRMALNQDLCDESAVLSEGCEVAFFPPVTGG